MPAQKPSERSRPLGHDASRFWNTDADAQPGVRKNATICRKKRPNGGKSAANEKFLRRGGFEKPDVSL